MTTQPWWQPEKWPSETAYLQPLSAGENEGENFVKSDEFFFVHLKPRMRAISHEIKDLLKSAHTENWSCWRSAPHGIFTCVPALDFEQIPWLQFAWLQVWLQQAPTLQPMPTKQHVRDEGQIMSYLQYSPQTFANTAADSIRFRREQARLDRITNQLERIDPCAGYDMPSSIASYSMRVAAELTTARNRQNLRDLFIFLVGDSPAEADADLAKRSDDSVDSLLKSSKERPFYGGVYPFRHGISQRIPYRGVNGEVEWRS